MFAYWILCSSCATYAVSTQIKVAKKASTVIRKSFHILAVLVFLPGLLFECTFIYLASGVALGIFIILEVKNTFLILFISNVNFLIAIKKFKHTTFGNQFTRWLYGIQ